MSWNDERPMSPHLQIYTLPLTAKLSILHRATGAVLFLALLVLVWGLLALVGGEQSWLFFHACLNHWLGLLFLLAMTFSIYLHLCNGVRHLIWDTGRDMGKNACRKSAWVVIGMTLLLTAITWLISI